jgi:hypothetical protein
LVKLASFIQSLKSKLFFANYRRIGSAIIIGMLLRLVLAAYTSDSGDFEVWYIAFLNMVSGLGSPYYTMYYSYPPVWAYFILPSTSFTLLFFNPYQLGTRAYLGGIVVSATSPFLNIAYKFSIFLAEIFVGLLIYDQVRKYKNENIAYKAFILWFFNPLVLFMGSIHGQMDTFATLLLVLAFCFFMEKKFFLSGTSIAIGAMVKIFPLYILPLYLVFILKLVFDKHLKSKFSVVKNTASHYFSIFSGLSLGAFIGVIPLLLFGSLSRAIEAVTTRGAYVASLGGFTPFVLVRSLTSDAFAWFNAYGRPQLVYSVLQLIFLVGALFVIIYYAFYTTKKPIYQRFLQAHIGVIITIYLTSLVVNPQYLLWIIPFLLISYGVYGNYLYRLTLLSIFAITAQLYWVRHYLNPLIFFSSLSQLGIYIDKMFVQFLDSVGYILMSISGLLGLFIIISLYFAKLPLKRIANRLRKDENYEPI